MVSHIHGIIDTPNFDDYDIRFVKSDEIKDLRYIVLYNSNGPKINVNFVGDDEPTTYHIALYCENELVSFISLMNETKKDSTELYSDENPIYRLRGVSTHPDFRGRRFATILIQYALIFLRNELKAKRIWFYARLNALSMYEKLGFKYTSDVFDIPPVGLHREMALELS